jgi:deoxycytidylate deaminase
MLFFPGEKLPRKFEIARAASLLSSARRSRQIGAALFSGSILLSVGNNEYGHTHPRSSPFCNLHAEHRCLLRRRWRENGNNLCIYVYRELSDGTRACSKPCSNCLNLLREAGVKTAYYFDIHSRIALVKL